MQRKLLTQVDKDQEIERLRRIIESYPDRRWLETDNPDVVKIMGSAPACAADGCQLDKEAKAAQLIADILEEYKDDLDKAACDRCENCGEAGMCRFHSVLSLVQGHTWTTAAINRDNARRRKKR